MSVFISIAVLLIWALYATARLVAPSAMVGSLEPIGTAAAITGLLTGPVLIGITIAAAGTAIRETSRVYKAIAALSLLGTLAVLAPRPTDSAPAGGALTVMSWNVGRLGGIHERDGKTAADEAKIRTTACLANQLALIEPDVLVLTEISRYDVESILEPALGSLSRRCVHAAHDAGKQLSSGTLVCAWSNLLAIKDHQIVEVTQGELPDQQYPLVKMSGPGGKLEVAGLHLPPIHRTPERWPSWTRAGLASAAQEAMVATIAEARDDDWPGVLAGDFNQSRHVWIHKQLRADYADAWESSQLGLGGTRLVRGQPAARIDYIYADRARLSVVDAVVARLGCADHDPVIARIRQR
ncbi:MAG: endonuclease/exonuclease/phosphatase family metal-dependent hydrolase [Myxococcota bacterium]|jgi:endonuclease/exonuclease/phosphatase family metal-dependent hydrolase